MAALVLLTDLPAALQSEELVQVWLDGANASAARVAPCLAATDPAPTEDQVAEAKLTLIGTISRWAQAGAGALASQTAGPFGQTLDTRVKTGYNLWPSEIERLQAICKNGKATAFSVDTAPGSSVDGYWSAPDQWTRL